MCVMTYVIISKLYSGDHFQNPAFFGTRKCHLLVDNMLKQRKAILTFKNTCIWICVYGV